MTGDGVLALYNGVVCPDYIKIDVDGIEHLILQGMRNLLKNKKLKSILVECNEDFHEHEEEVKNILSDSGFVLCEKKHAPIFENSRFASSYNCIWYRE